MAHFISPDIAQTGLPNLDTKPTIPDLPLPSWGWGPCHYPVVNYMNIYDVLWWLYIITGLNMNGSFILIYIWLR